MLKSTPTDNQELDRQLDIIILKPAAWRYDDYLTAKAEVKRLITLEKNKARKAEAEYILDNCAYKYKHNNRMISPMLIKDRINQLTSKDKPS